MPNVVHDSPLKAGQGLAPDTGAGGVTPQAQYGSTESFQSLGTVPADPVLPANDNVFYHWARSDTGQVWGQLNGNKQLLWPPTTGEADTNFGGTLTLGAVAFADITNATVTVTNAGKYLVVGVFDFQGTVTGWGIAQGQLVVASSGNQPNNADCVDTGAAIQGGTYTMAWVVTLAAGDVIKLQAKKTIAAGTITADGYIRCITIAGASGGGGGGGAVSSVFARTGAVVAAANDYTWAQVNKATSSLADIATRAQTALTGTNWTTTYVSGSGVLTELMVGAASTVMQGHGVTAAPTWTGTPQLSGIADTGATARVGLATSSPHVTLTGNVWATGSILSADPGMGVSPVVSIQAHIVPSIDLTMTGLIVDVGGLTSATSTGATIGVAGYAIANDATGAAKIVYGLSFVAGFANTTGTATTASPINATLYIAGITATIANAYFLRMSFTNDGSGTITTFTALNLQGSSATNFGTAKGLVLGSFSGAGVKWCPLEINGPAGLTLDTSGSFHRNNFMFGSATRSFGGGDGVVGIATAATEPGAPTGAVLLYTFLDAASNTIPGFYSQGANFVATGQADSVSSVRVKMRLNGVTRTFLCI
jgi:hypothetical protein